MGNQPTPKLADIPRSDLVTDLVDSIEDAAVCEFALEAQIFTYSGGNVFQRLQCNRRFIEVISAELSRRRKEELRTGESLIGGALATGGDHL